ncbi:hypothetical protein Tco_0794772 [Tanacetum coccineum]
MPTKIELTLEQSQQGVSNDVLVMIATVVCRALRSGEEDIGFDTAACAMAFRELKREAECIEVQGERHFQRGRAVEGERERGEQELANGEGGLLRPCKDKGPMRAMAQASKGAGLEQSAAVMGAFNGGQSVYTEKF